MKVNIKIKAYANLKDIFSEESNLEFDEAVNLKTIVDRLLMLKPESEDILLSSRFAVGESFVNMNDIIEDGTELMLLPPSSGG